MRVIHVEDLASPRRLVADMLSRIGGLQLVATASRAGEATSWIEQHPGGWDIAIVDLVLDGGSGLEVIRHGRTRHPAGRIVVFSSVPNQGVRQDCLRLGADAVFDKMECGDFALWLDRQKGLAA